MALYSVTILHSLYLLLISILQTPVKKPLTKAEKGIADAWDRGHHDMLSWRTGCLSPDGQKEKGIITAICVDRVSAIIIACFPTDPYCIAFTPEQEIDISVWAGSTKGRKKQDLSADSTVYLKSILEN